MKTDKMHRGIVRYEKQTDEIGRLAVDRDERLLALTWAAPRQLIGADQAGKARGRESRTKRNSRIWKRGNLVRIAGLLDLDRQVLLGALRRAARFESDPKWMARWRAEGHRILGAAGDLSRGPELPDAGKNADPKAARKVLNHRIMTVGGIVEQAGMGGWETAVLVGLLVMIAHHRNDPSRVATWKAAGMADVEKRANDRVHVEARFPEPIARKLGLELAKLGITYDREKLVWMGFADPILTRQAAKKGDGEVRVRAKSKTKTRGKRSRKKSTERGNAGRRRSHLVTGPTAGRSQRRAAN
jgi:hypothetical protein